MKQSVARFVQRVSEVADTEKSVDVHSWMSQLVLEILLSTFFGQSTNLQGSASSDGEKLCRHITSVFDASKKGGRVDIFRGRLMLCKQDVVANVTSTLSLCLFVCLSVHVPAHSLSAAAFPFITSFVGMMIRRSEVGQSMAKVVDVALKIIADRKSDQTTVSW